QPLTGLTRTITKPAELPAAMAEAFHLFEAARPRPAVLNLTLDMLRAPATLADAERARTQRPHPAETDIAAPAKLTDAAQRPMVIFGGGCVDYAAEARAFVRKAGAIAVTTTAGKGIIADSDPATLGSTLQSTDTQTALAAADLVIAIGTELAETDHWG